MTFDAVILLFDEAKELNRSIPWRTVKDARNLYVHSYGNVDLEMVWNTMQDDTQLFIRKIHLKFPVRFCFRMDSFGISGRGN